MKSVKTRNKEWKIQLNGIVCGCPIRGGDATDDLSATGITGFTGDPILEKPANDDISVSGITGFTDDPRAGNLQTIALTHAPGCMSVFLFSVIPRRASPACSAIK